jgi:hypothetical protein
MALGLAARGAFLCIGKYPAEPARCEDRAVLALPDAAAVIDGATDISGARFGGRTGGWLAADALSRFVLAAASDGSIRRWTGAEFVARANGVLRNLYAQLGLLEDARRDPERRFRAGAVVAIAQDEGVRIVNVAMPGVRIDGVLQPPNTPLDHFEPVLTRMRTLLWHDPDMASLEPGLREKTLHALLVAGRPAANAAQAQAWARAEERLRADMPAQADKAHIEAALAHGLWGSRRAHQGDPSHSPAIDGFHDAAPPDWETTRAFGAYRTLELFSDGYQSLPATSDIAAWEAEADKANREDPHRVGASAAIKGRVPGGHHDDRTVVVLHTD